MESDLIKSHAQCYLVKRTKIVSDFTVKVHILKLSVSTCVNGMTDYKTP